MFPAFLRPSVSGKKSSTHYVSTHLHTHFYLSSLQQCRCRFTKNEMVSNSVFNTYWPIIKILQILGTFPIQKTVETSCGFKVMPSKPYRALSLTIQVLSTTSYMLSWYYIITRQEPPSYYNTLCT